MMESVKVTHGCMYCTIYEIFELKGIWLTSNSEQCILLYNVLQCLVDEGSLGLYIAMAGTHQIWLYCLEDTIIKNK